MKKMRRLIPAIAMLLVSAVMLSTASFAWFTMNTEVSASGLQLQAKADSSLVISTEPLTTSNGKPDVIFADTSVHKLVPMTYNSTATTPVVGAQLTDATIANGFVAPDSTADVNIQTGIYDDDAYSAATDYVEEELYIASAGDAISSTTLTFELSAPSVAAGDYGAAKAYAAAIYVISSTTDAAWADNAKITDNRDPNAIIFVDTTNGRFTCNVPNVAIPSVVGAGEGTNPAVGVKIVIRFYVDGALKDLVNKTPVNEDYLYTSATTYTAGGNYFKPTFEPVDKTGVTTIPFGWYTVADGVYTKANVGAAVAADTTYYEVTGADAVILTAEQQVAGAALPSGSYTRAMGTVDKEYTFVRSAIVPSGGTELVVTIKTGTPSGT